MAAIPPSPEGPPWFRMRPCDLTASGWLLATMSMRLVAWIDILIAHLARDAVERDVLRVHPPVVSLLLALPGTFAAMLSFHFVRRAMERVGIVVERHDGSTSNRER